MGEESSEMHSEDEKGGGLVEKKNKKRMVKTAAQLEALENFFKEDKYPPESRKIQLAEAVGLTEKQVSGWFCHRRLKDRKLMCGDSNPTGKQERSSGVIQDRGSGHKQDSCGSTKQGDERNFDNKEVESGRLMSRDYSAVDLAHEHGNRKYGSEDTTSGSSSPRRDVSNHRNRDPFDNETSMCLVPKLPEHETRVKARSGPSGYLKLKGRVENAAITAVKRQMGKDYRDDGPPLCVEFDSLPPGAFDFPTQNPPPERYYSRELIAPALSDVSRFRQNQKFDEGREHDYENNQVDEPIFRTRHEFRSPNSYMHQNFGRTTTSSGNSGAYYPHRTSAVEPFEGLTRNIHHPRPDHWPYGSKVRERASEPRFNNKFSATGLAASYRENMKNEYPDSTMVPEASSFNDGLSRPSDNGFSRQIFKTPKRMNDEVHPRQQQRSSPMLDSFPISYPAARYGKVIPRSLSDDDESAETSCSVD